MTERLVLEVPVNGSPEDAFYAAVDALIDSLGVEIAPVEKAAGESPHKPHPAQFQARTEGGQFMPTPPVSHAARLSHEECMEARLQAAALQSDEILPRFLTHTADYLKGSITAVEWEDRFSKDIRYFYSELYRVGKQAGGNPGVILSPQDKAIINRVIADELHFAHGFREDMEAGGGQMDYMERTRLYANAAWEAFWTGFVLGDLSPGRHLMFEYGGTEEHCGLHDGGEALGCSDFHAMGWMTAPEFLERVVKKGFAPRSGMLECKGVKCRCWLRERLDGIPEWEQSPP